MKYLFLLLALYAGTCIAATEEEHTIPWCESLGGKYKRADVKLADGTFPDCVTDEYIIEVDRAHKWYEGIGQSLHYAFMDGKRKPMLALIVFSEKDNRFVERAKAIGRSNCPKIKVVVIPGIK